MALDGVIHLQQDEDSQYEQHERDAMKAIELSDLKKETCTLADKLENGLKDDIFAKNEEYVMRTEMGTLFASTVLPERAPKQGEWEDDSFFRIRIMKYLLKNALLKEWLPLGISAWVIDEKVPDLTTNDILALHYFQLLRHIPGKSKPDAICGPLTMKDLLAANGVDLTTQIKEPQDSVFVKYKETPVILTESEKQKYTIPQDSIKVYSLWDTIISVSNEGVISEISQGTNTQNIIPALATTSNSIDDKIKWLFNTTDQCQRMLDQVIGSLQVKDLKLENDVSSHFGVDNKLLAKIEWGFVNLYVKRNDRDIRNNLYAKGRLVGYSNKTFVGHIALQEIFELDAQNLPKEKNNYKNSIKAMLTTYYEDLWWRSFVKDLKAEAGKIKPTDLVINESSAVKAHVWKLPNRLGFSRKLTKYWKWPSGEPQLRYGILGIDDATSQSRVLNLKEYKQSDGKPDVEKLKNVLKEVYITDAKKKNTVTPVS